MTGIRFSQDGIIRFAPRESYKDRVATPDEILNEKFAAREILDIKYQNKIRLLKISVEVFEKRSKEL